AACAPRAPGAAAGPRAVAAPPHVGREQPVSAAGPGRRNLISRRPLGLRPGRWHAGCFSSRASQLVRTPEEVMNTNRLILSSLLAASLLSTPSLATAHATRRFKRAHDALPRQ